MQSKIILQPASNQDALRHYVETIQTPVQINRIISKLTPSQLDELPELFEGRSTISV